MKIKGAFPVRWAAQNGADATLYELTPSAEKITRKHDGTVSPATINCKAYKKTGTDDPELITSVAQRSYDYYEGTVKHTVNNYTGDNITPTPWWTKIVFYLKSSEGVLLTKREILIENEDVSPEQNLLNDTNFTNLLLDSSTNRFNSEVIAGEGVDGSNALFCNPEGLESVDAPYTEVWMQSVSKETDKRLLPSTWYTLSFWAKTLGYSQIYINKRSNLYGFATRSVYLVAATHSLRIRGNVSPLALSADRELRVFIYKEDWSWQTYVSIKQSKITESEVSFTPPSDGTYKITAYCYIAGGGDAAAAQAVYLEWYRLKLANRTNILHSYCYPNVIDTEQVQVHDGNVIDSRPSDGKNIVMLTKSWKRFYMVFKTKPTIPTDVNSVLFRIPQNGNSIYLSQMKLERGVFPTAWSSSNNDTKGYSGAKPYFRKFSEIKGKEIKVYQGVGDEEWYTIVYDDVKNTGWYTPKYTHTTTKDEVLTDAAKWLMSSMNFVATSVFFAQMAYIENLGVRNVLLSDGSTIEGGMCHSDKNDAGGSLGLGDVRFWLGNANPALGKIRGYYNGKFVAADGKAVFDSSGDVTLCGGNAKFDKNGNTTINNLTAANGRFTGADVEGRVTAGTGDDKITMSASGGEGSVQLGSFGKVGYEKDVSYKSLFGTQYGCDKTGLLRVVATGKQAGDGQTTEIMGCAITSPNVIAEESLFSKKSAAFLGSALFLGQNKYNVESSNGGTLSADTGQGDCYVFGSSGGTLKLPFIASLGRVLFVVSEGNLILQTIATYTPEEYYPNIYYKGTNRGNSYTLAKGVYILFGSFSGWFVLG